MIDLKELVDMKDEYEHEKIFVEAKISVVNSLIEKEVAKVQGQEQVEIGEPTTI